MNKFVASAIILSILLISSCEPTITFDKPQPDSVKSLQSFSKRLQGNYIAADQASIVTITDKFITRHYNFDFKEHKDSLSSTYKLDGDTIINLTEGSRERIFLKGDTVIQHADWIDTLFNISTNNVLKKFKGYYFLNSRYSDNDWEVKKLSLNKGVLTVGSISDKDDLQKLKETTENTDDTTSTPIILTRQQFKRFIRQDGFAEQEMFTRMTENHN